MKKSQKKTLTNLITTIVIVVLLLLALKVFAAPLFEDNFDSYDVGELDGQGDWNVSDEGRPLTYDDLVESANCYSGKCIEQANYGATAWRNATSSENGSLFFKLNPLVMSVNSGTIDYAIGDFRADQTLGNNYCAKIELYRNIIKYGTNGAITTTTEIELATSTQTNLGFEWDFTIAKKVRFYLEDNWTEWQECSGYASTSIFSFIHIPASGGTPAFLGYIDEFTGDEPPPPQFNIISPVDGTELSEAFTITAQYHLDDDYNKTMIIFEDWESSSTCPIWGSEDFETEIANGWFNYQSLPYFSDSFTTSSGTTTIDIDDLPSGNYNCIRCYFINEATELISSEVCEDYDINITSTIPYSDTPLYELPITDWDTYYTEHTNKWATSTELFDSLTSTFNPLIVWIGKISMMFDDKFDSSEAKERGAEMGQAIAIGRGYVENFDDFFGGLPVSYILIFYILVSLAVIIFRIIKALLHIIVP